MLTVPQAFDKLRQNLEVPDAVQEVASRGRNEVLDALGKHLRGISWHFPAGSFARRTAISPLRDVDIFVVLDPAVHGDVYPTTNVSPSACLDKVHRALLATFPAAERQRVQNRSVGIWLHGLRYDVVPAFANRAGVYIIPDRERDEWIQSEPEAHGEALIAADKRTGSKLNALIKMAKQWKCTRGVELRSFHLEVMTYDAFSQPPASYPEGIRALFAHLAGAVPKRYPDPARVGPNIDAGTARTSARDALIAAESEARTALEHDRIGRTLEAHRIWRRLFGDAYPEG